MQTDPLIAMVALDGVSSSSAGTMLDCYAFMRGRVEQILVEESEPHMATRLKVLSLDGKPVAMNGGGLLPVDGAVDPGEFFRFIWIPAFRGRGTGPVQERIASMEPFFRWLRDQIAEGALVGASGISAFILVAAKLTGDMAVPIAPALRPLARTLFPRTPIDETVNFTERGPLLISSGQAHDYVLMTRAFERALAPNAARWLRSIVGLPDRMQKMPADDLLMQSASLWLDQRFATRLSIKDLAEEHSLSHSALSRRFRKAFGLSPKAYVQQLRINAAQHQLAFTNRSIDMIAALVGFSDPRLFRAAFRQHTGMTASEWRRSNNAPPSD